MSQRLFSKLMAALSRRISNVVLRGVVTAVNSATKMQTLQITLREGESKANVDHIEPYGFTSNPQPGAEHITLFMAGDRSHGVVIVTGDRRFRLTSLLPGEVALHDDQNQVIHFKRDKILIDTPKDFEVNAKNIRLHATDSYQFDVNGQGQKWDGAGVETWQDDDITKPHHDHEPPKIP